MTIAKVGACTSTDMNYFQPGHDCSGTYCPNSGVTAWSKEGQGCRCYTGAATCDGSSSSGYCHQLLTAVAAVEAVNSDAKVGACTSTDMNYFQPGHDCSGTCCPNSGVTAWSKEGQGCRCYT